MEQGGGSKLINQLSGSNRTSGVESEPTKRSEWPRKSNRCFYSEPNIVQAGGFQLERGKRHSNIQLNYYKNTKCLCKVSVRIWRIGAEDGESMQSCKVGSHEGQSDLLINKIVF